MTPARRLGLLLGSGLLVAGAPAGAPAETELQVAVLDHPVDAGDIIAERDLVAVSMSASAARGALRARDIGGMEAVRRLPAGSIVRSGDLIRPQLVRRGEPVTITVRNGPLLISTTGRALANGSAGATVRVVTQSTNKTLEGKVEGPGAVRVLAN